ncbi:hypothetical protein BN1723_006160 [Verticillium longisporum]|uniref:Uncharacterized protein n=1 Tax=Verticillium longisporum TaxID=100787 RepID=A0A0G4NDL1_VERLO|nr:hypothetical protein BN1723_006160 [Verticillium longisporum]
MRPFFGLLAAAAGLASAAELQHITDFGPNPTNVSFYLYVPDAVRLNAPLLVYPHWCWGSAQNAFDWKPYRPLADELGFIVIYPSSPNDADHCWDVSSPQTLSHDAGGDSLGIVSMVRWTLANHDVDADRVFVTGISSDGMMTNVLIGAYPDVFAAGSAFAGTLLHDAGGDSLGIVSMVRWTLAHHDVDADRVFVTGISSGGMMTNVLIGAYPDVFAAGSAFAGVPFGCYAADGFAVWSDDCAKGKIQHTGDEWAALVHAAYPAYGGVRPKMQVLHGAADDIINATNYHEAVKLWTTVLRTGSEPREVDEDTPQAGWTKSVYGRRGFFEAFLADGVDHNIPDQAQEVVRFFELDCVGDDCFSRKDLVVPGNCVKKKL